MWDGQAAKWEGDDNFSPQQQLVFIIILFQERSNMKNNLQNANLSIGIQSLSPKQLLGECIDIATHMLKDLIKFFCETNKEENPFTNEKVDFSSVANYVLDPVRLQHILSQFVKFDQKSMKQLARTWLFELKNLRNCWAHSESVDKRLAIRGFDTLGLLFEVLSGDTTSDMFNKIEMYRKMLTISLAKTYV